ncbi:MAG: DUF1569 domain-containing protein, partial [Planctomycetota bacterium]|nr:DUF1569 domain-containing protein [Planctomycetota bacterium]
MNRIDGAARSPERREVVFETPKEALAALDSLEAAAREGRLRPEGAWSAGQNFQHCAKFIRFAYDGFPFKAPLALR